MSRVEVKVELDESHNSDLLLVTVVNSLELNS